MKGALLPVWLAISMNLGVICTSEAGDGECDLHPVEIGFRAAYLDRSGRVVIPPVEVPGTQFSHGSEFHDGLAAITFDGKAGGYIDRTGKIVIPPIFSAAYPFRDGLATVWKDEKSGVIDRSGRYVIPLREGPLIFFSEGLAAFTSQSKTGYFATNGRIAITARFEKAYSFTEGLAPARESGRWGFIDRNGSWVLPPRFAEVHGYFQGLASVRVGNKWGFIDRTGRLAIPARFDEVTRFHEGLCAVRVGDGWGFIDRRGGSIVAPIYEGAGPFQEGLAPVVRGGLQGYVDYLGREVVGCQFGGTDQWRQLHTTAFCGEVATIELSLSSWILIDRAGKVIWASWTSEFERLGSTIALVLLLSALAGAAIPRLARMWAVDLEGGELLILRRLGWIQLGVGILVPLVSLLAVGCQMKPESLQRDISCRTKGWR